MLKKGFVFTELLILLAIVALLAALFFPALARAREAARRASCQNNLKTWALVFKMYAAEDRGMRYPPLQAARVRSESGWLDSPTVCVTLGPEAWAVHPEYAADLSIATCPSSPDAREHLREDGFLPVDIHPELIGMSYAYFGWIFDRVGVPMPGATSPEDAELNDFKALNEALALLKIESDNPSPIPRQVGAAFDSLFAKGLPAIQEDNGLKLLEETDKDLPVPRGLGTAGGEKVYRLREGIERFLITDINSPTTSTELQSQVWIMLDLFFSGPGTASFNHVPGGSNVLFLDGHVEFIKYPAKPPLTPGMGAFLGIMTSSA